MAGGRKNDLLGRLADLSEEAIQRLAEAPGADKAFQALNGLRERVDELQRRVRGIEELEKRLAALEKKVDRLSRGGAAGSGSASRSRARTTTRAKSGTTPKKS